MIRWLLAFVLVPSLSWGGINFAMTSSEPVRIDIPDFKSRGEAIKFANNVKWNDQVLHDLRQLMHGYFYMTWLEGDPTIKEIENAAWYAQQWEFCQLAIKVIKNFQRHGVRGPQDSAQIAIPEFPSRQDAIWWAQWAKRDPSLELRLKRQIAAVYIKLQSFNTFPPQNPHTAGWTQAQYERLQAALAEVRKVDKAILAVPEFKSMKEAYWWAKALRFNADEALQALHHRMRQTQNHYLANRALYKLRPKLAKEQEDLAAHYYLAYWMIENYKRKGEHGNPGACFYAYSIPVKKP